MRETERLLDVKAVGLALADNVLLAPISLRLERGELLWLSGPSGAGKSTLLKIIASLREPSVGEVCFQGRPLTAWKPEYYRQRVSYCCQTPTLFGCTVYDNLAFPYQIRHCPPQRQRMVAGLQRLNLPASVLDCAIEPLSGGEKQRVALLRHLQFPPDILLLDEITSALDDANKQAVRQLIEEQVQQGMAAIWISHDRHEIDKAQRQLVLPAPPYEVSYGIA